MGAHTKKMIDIFILEIGAATHLKEKTLLVQSLVLSQTVSSQNLSDVDQYTKEFTVFTK